jgi:hypothetical protein
MMRRVLLAILGAAIAAAPARADRKVPFLPADKLPDNVKVHEDGDPADGVMLEITPGKAATTTIIEDADPKAPSHLYMLKGTIRYENVEPAGYVEMWSHFPGGGAYFTRTLADEIGPMQKLAGTHNWRDLALPFQSKPGMLPEKLVVNVVLPGKGKVFLTNLTLTKLEAPEEQRSAGVPGAWWSDRGAGWIGGLGGAAVGIMGAIVGTLCGVGVGRQLCFGLAVAAIAVCALCLAAGIVAVTTGQPYHVYYPLFLLGIIGVTVFGFNLPTIRKRFDAIELRRMTALDA